MSKAKRDYSREITQFLRKRTTIEMRDGRIWSGYLNAITTEGLGFIVLSKGTLKTASNDFVREVHKVFININDVVTIYLEEEPFDIRGLATELEKVFRQPGHVKLYEESGLIVVLDRVKVNESGVEGVGPVADRVRAIFNRFKDQIKSEGSGSDDASMDSSINES